MRNSLFLTQRWLAYLGLLFIALLGFTPLISHAQIAKGTLTVTGSPLPAYKATPADTEWPMYNKDLLGQRYTALNQINSTNVGNLKEVCRVKVGELTSFHTGPILIEGALYVTTARDTFAIDPTNCKVLWKSTWEPEDMMAPTSNRGVAYAQGRLFRGTNDGRMIALDAKTGALLWKTTVADPKLAYYMSAAPITWNGMVFMGTAGSDSGIRGKMFAFDAATGKEIWRFNTIPSAGEIGYDTWKNGVAVETGGGGFWTSFSLDVQTGEVFIPVANPAPDFNVAYRPGDNLFTNSLVVLDAKNGKLKWWYQATPNDGYDYDLAAAPTLYQDSQSKALVALGSKDGYVYRIDRETHKLLSKTPVTTIDNVGAPTPEGVKACPGTLGGVEWNGNAFDPINKSLYVGAVDWCTEFKSEPVKYVPGEAFSGGSKKQVGKATGWVTSINSDNGEIRWKYEAGSAMVAGMTPTAGNILFSGSMGGSFFALDSLSGKPLFTFNTGGAIAGGVITYLQKDKQYVATTSGNVSRSSQSFNPLSLGTPTVIIFALPK